MLKQQETLFSPEKRSAALNALALTLFFSHRLEEMEARTTEAIAAAKLAGNEELRLQTMALLGLKHLCYGELAEGKSVLDDVIQTSRTINHKPTLAAGLTWRGCLYFFQTEYERAIEIETEARKLASELRDGFLLLTSMFFLGLSNGNLGRMSEALSTLNEAIGMARRNGDSFWGPRMPNCIGWIHRELQDFEGALKHDEEGLDVSRQHHVLEAEANSLINLGIDYTHSGKSEETISAFQEVRDIFERDAWFRWRYNIRLHAAMVEHALRRQDPAQAREIAERLLDTASQYEVHKYIAVAHKLMAQIAVAEGNTKMAEAEFAAALGELGKYPVPVVTWRTYAELGHLKSSLGDVSAARDAFARAAEIANDIATHITDTNLRETFLNSDAVREVMTGAIKQATAN
jgi:tetratricopeptide (TPR) repeat protein